MRYDLHLTFSEKLLVELKKVNKKLKIKSVSGSIAAIFEKYLPFLEKYQVEFQNRNSRYKLIADPGEKRRHVHAYVPEKIYRKLKELHQYLNFYSIAQIIREIVELYLKECTKNGVDGAMRKIKKIKGAWEKKKLERKGMEYIRQLYISNTPILSTSITYDANFHPYSIKFILYNGRNSFL